MLASYYGYEVTFNYDGMDTLMHTKGWTVERIAVVYVLPSIVCLLIGVVSLLIYRSIPTTKIHYRTLFAWLAFNGLLYYYSLLLTGLLSDFQFNSRFFTAYVSLYAWLGWTSNKVMVVLILQTLVSGPFVYFLVKPFHELSYSNQLMASRNSLKKWNEFLLLPILAGLVIIVFATWPMDIHFGLVRMLSALILSLWMLLFMNFRDSGSYLILKGGFSRTSKLVFLLAVMSLMLLSRFVLSLKFEL